MSVTEITGIQKVYDFMWRYFNAIRKKSASRGQDNTVTFKPYPSSGTLRTYAVDTIAYPGFGKRLPKRTDHHKDGSFVTLEYEAMHKPTPKQIALAKRAVVDQKIPRDRYTSRIVDVFLHKGAIYVLVQDVQERDDDDDGNRYRMMNVDGAKLKKIRIEEVGQRKQVSVPRIKVKGGK